MKLFPSRRVLCTPDSHVAKLQAQVYHTRPPTTAIVNHAIGLEKLSANEQVFDSAQMAVSL